MDTMKKKIPALRFPGFVDDWENVKIGKISKVSSGGTPNRTRSDYWNGDIPWVTTSLIDFNQIMKSNEFITKEGMNNSSAKIFPKGSLLIALYGQGITRGKVAILGIDATTNQACAMIGLHHTKANTKFVFYDLQNKYKKIRNLSNDGGQKNLSGELVKAIKIFLPTLPEQQKIAGFLTAVDEKINRLTRKKTLLEQYKKGVMQQIFAQDIRFKDDEGKAFPEWEQKKFAEITQKFSNRNKELTNIAVYSVTNSNGFVRQIEHFDKRIASSDLSNYKIIHMGDFAYNPARINVGSIAHFKDKIGLISSLYVCFRTTKEIIAPFLLNILDLESTKYQINNLGEGGVRIYLWYELFSLIKCKIPCLVEQQKIADFLTGIDKKIEQVDTQLETTKQWKRGLLQQLFV